MKSFAPKVTSSNPVPEGTLQRSILRHLLESKLLLTRAHRRLHESGFSTADEVIPTNRYILVLKGRLKYEIEGIVAEVRENRLIHVPAWVRRRWWVPRGEICENLWCEFSIQAPPAIPTCLFTSSPASPAEEKTSLLRILKLWQEIPPQDQKSLAVDSWTNLRMEGELKAGLARFWPLARTRTTLVPNPLPQHPAVKAALAAWMEGNFQNPNAAARLFETIELSPNHFRLLFRQQTGRNPARCLKEIRLRQARNLLHQSNRPVKEIAALTGFADPLHFTKQYHRFWGHPPTHDRSTDFHA